MNTLTPDMHRDTDFSHLFEAIEIRMKEVPSMEKKKSASVENDSTSDENINVGNIEIGGDVSGNIVVGNNNQVSDRRGKNN